MLSIGPQRLKELHMLTVTAPVMYHAGVKVKRGPYAGQPMLQTVLRSTTPRSATRSATAYAAPAHCARPGQQLQLKDVLVSIFSHGPLRLLLGSSVITMNFSRATDQSKANPIMQASTMAPHIVCRSARAIGSMLALGP